MKENNKIMLYHTGYAVIDEPDVHYGRVNADFGQGFYTTPNREFASRWAKDRRGQQPTMNTYELDLTDLKVHRFERTVDWFNYIFHNRRGHKDELDADLVMGPIANDTIYDTLGIITSGYLEDEQALELLLVGPEYIQIALKTEKAASQLQWIEAREIPLEEVRENKKILGQEQEEYLRVIGEKLEQME